MYTVSLFFKGELCTIETFPSKEKALEYYNFRLPDCRFGRIGWTISYPERTGY